MSRAKPRKKSTKTQPRSTSRKQSPTPAPETPSASEDQEDQSAAPEQNGGVSGETATAPESVVPEIGAGAGAEPEPEPALGAPATMSESDAATLPELAPALLALKEGRLLEARKNIDALLAKHPDAAPCWYHSAGIALAEKKGALALQHFGKAVSLAPDDARIRFDFGSFLARIGRNADCVRLLTERPVGAPFTLRADFLVGLSCMRLQRWDEAVAAFDRVLAAEPAYIDAMTNRAAALFSTGKRDEAMVFLRNQIESHPTEPVLRRSLAYLQFRRGDLAGAQATLDAALPHMADPVATLTSFSDHFFKASSVELALYAAEKAQQLKPEDVDTLLRASMYARRAGRRDQAFAWVRQVLEREPDNAVAWNSLGNLHSDYGDRSRAAQAYKKAMEADPNFTLAFSNGCRTFLEDGDVDSAAEAARKVLRLKGIDANLIPLPFSVIQNIADFDTKRLIGRQLWRIMDGIAADRLDGILLSLLPQVKAPEDYDQLFRHHCRWGDYMKSQADRQPLPPPPPPRNRSAGDKLRIAFLSSDLRSHNVAKYVLPFLRYYDHERYEVTIYSSWPGPVDPVQQGIIEMVAAYKKVAGQPHAKVSQLIRQDQMDILIELNGITRFSQAEVLCHRAAPVQISWLGYPFTMGLPNVDYQLLDPLVCPTEAGHMREEPLNLPNSWICFDFEDPLTADASKDFPIADPPFQANGYVTFGSLNKAYKYSDRCIALWSKVLQAAPGSKFAVIRPEARSQVFIDNLSKAFGEYGIPPERLVFIGNEPGRHLQHYGAFDISLDTLPQTGGVTTTESLWMGVPVITLYQNEIFERMSYSILSNAGLGDLAAPDEEGYVAAAAGLAADTERLAELRRSLRERLRASPLCDSPTFAKDFGEAMERVAKS